MTDALRIRAGRVLDPVDGEPRIADLVVRDGRIEAVIGPYDDGPVAIVDATGGLLIPGPVNSHPHSHGSIAKGKIGECWRLETFLTADPALNGGRSAHEKRVSASLAVVELIRRGCTAALDRFVELPFPTVILLGHGVQRARPLDGGRARASGRRRSGRHRLHRPGSRDRSAAGRCTTAAGDGGERCRGELGDDRRALRPAGGADITTIDEQALWREAGAAATSPRQRAAGGLAASRPPRDATASFRCGFRGCPIDDRSGPSDPANRPGSQRDRQGPTAD